LRTILIIDRSSSLDADAVDEPAQVAASLGTFFVIMVDCHNTHSASQQAASASYLQSVIDVVPTSATTKLERALNRLFANAIKKCSATHAIVAHCQVIACSVGKRSIVIGVTRTKQEVSEIECRAQQRKWCFASRVVPNMTICANCLNATPYFFLLTE
jgi:hypothetical protein